ncbi:hypothetical protein Poly41_62250 [Novipirellula artificiosorum]|uniref:Uncharacterized protein n=1 Tax=Novipirellula artificiosorum TaxID=2528016 RepID=A0A5C6D7Z5_9BACT|nr:hypothetical protein Poly41_62250 [Novipirellula artificiosorum]
MPVSPGNAPQHAIGTGFAFGIIVLMFGAIVKVFEIALA